MWSWNFFTFLFCGIITHILAAFSIIFLTLSLWKTAIHLLGLSSKVFTFDHLFGNRSDFFNNLAIFLGLNGQKAIKIDAWAEAQAVETFIFMKE